MSEQRPHLFVRTVTPLDTEAVLSLWCIVFPEYSDPARPQRDPRVSFGKRLG